MPITNGYDEARVLPALAIRMGWLQPTDSNYPTLATANKASTSGRYYNDDSYHAACTIQNLYDCQPDSSITAEGFNSYLQQLQKGVLLGMLDAVIGEPQLIETGLVYGKCTNETYRYVSGNKFCGIDNLPMTEAGEIILIGIKMAGSAAAADVDVKINDGAGVYFSNMADLVNWMNETFITSNNLHGSFNISVDQYLNYSNPEEFLTGCYILESGIFSFQFSDAFA